MIIRNDSIIYKRYFGTWSDATYQPIASGSKMPSMGLIMTLIDQGIMSLDDTVQNYIPSFSSKPIITLTQLMNHTSGLPGNSNYINDNALTLQQAVDSIGQRTAMTLFAPGEVFQYGGVSMHVAGRMAEIATGKKWDVIFNEKFGTPLSLVHTDYLGLGATTNYRIAGGMGTTMPDYGKLLNMFYHYGNYNGVQIIDTASVIAMQTDQTKGVSLINTPYSGDPLRENLRYGFGVWLEKINPTNNSVVQCGDQGAFGFTPWIDRCRNMSVVFFVRKTLAAIQPTHTKLRELIEQVVPIAIPKPSITYIASQLKSSANTGNQWLLNGVEISGATSQFYTPLSLGSYSVRVTNLGGCDMLSDVYDYKTTSMPSTHNESLNIYPNPTKGKFLIQLSSSLTTSITITNPAGVKVKAMLVQGESNEIDLSDCVNGVYVLTIKNDLDAVNKKIILSK